MLDGNSNVTFLSKVLPERSHPEVLMSGGGGYILSGIVVDNTALANDASVPEDNSQSNGRKRKRFRR